jgi:hypothetical protein
MLLDGFTGEIAEGGADLKNADPSSQDSSG